MTFKSFQCVLWLLHILSQLFLSSISFHLYWFRGTMAAWCLLTYTTKVLGFDLLLYDQSFSIAYMNSFTNFQP